MSFITLLILSNYKENPNVHIRGFIPVNDNGVVIVRIPTEKEIVNIKNYKFDVEIKNALAGVIMKKCHCPFFAAIPKPL